MYPEKLIYNGSMGNTNSKIKPIKGKKSRTKILYRPGKQDSLPQTTGGAADPTVPTHWFSLPDVTDDTGDKGNTRTRSNSLDAGISFSLEHPEALKQPLVENGVKRIEVTLPKISNSPRNVLDENVNDAEECAEDKEIVKIIRLASNQKKVEDKNNNLSKVELVVNSPQETLLKQYLREIRVSKQNISSITHVTSKTSTESKVSGSLQESQRLQISRSTPNLIEFDKPLTVKQDSAESLPKLLGTDPFESPPELPARSKAPKKYPRTFEYDRSLKENSPTSSAFVSTKLHRRRHTEIQHSSTSESVSDKRLSDIPGIRRPVSLYQDPPRSNYQKRLETHKKEKSASNSLRPISAPMQEVRYRNSSQGSTTSAELRQRRHQICSYPNIKPAQLEELMKPEHHKTERNRTESSYIEYRHDRSHEHSPQGSKSDSRRIYNSNEGLNLWRANHEKGLRSTEEASQKDKYKYSPGASNSLERRRIKPPETYLYSSQTAHQQSNMNGFYNDLDLSTSYNTTGRIRKVQHSDGQASPANSWSERSGSSTTPRIEKRERVVKHTSWEDQAGLIPIRRFDRSSKSPLNSHGSNSPHSSHSDPYEPDLSLNTRPRGDHVQISRPEPITGIPKAREEYHRLGTRPMLRFKGEGNLHAHGESQRIQTDIPGQHAEQHHKRTVHHREKARREHVHEKHVQSSDQLKEHVQPHAKLIETNLGSLCEKIDLNDSGLWEVLLAKGIITRRKCDKIKARYPEESEQVNQVLHVLQKCSGEDFKAFKAALEATGQGHVVRQLLLSTAGSNAVDRWRIALARYYLEESHLSDLPLYPLDNNWKAGEIKRYYTRTTFVDVTARGSFTEERVFDMYHNLFVNNRGLPLHRVALAGEAGSGKSVLARKMTLDWAQGVLTSYLTNESPPRGERDVSGGSEEEAFLEKFKLLVYIDLENLSSSISVRDLLLHRINYKEQHDCAGIDSFLRDHQRECLLIFDSWDAFQSKTAPALGLIAQGRAMQNTPVLFTYRMECEGIPSAVERTFEIRGFDEEQAREYIVKLLYSQGQQSHINKLTGFISKKRLWSKYSSPDALNLLCFSFTHGRNTLSQTQWKLDI